MEIGHLEAQELDALACRSRRRQAIGSAIGQDARMRLLVTGGAGYIGSVVAALLLGRGHDVTVLDSLERGHRAAVPAGAGFVQADLRDPDALKTAIEPGYDAALHFAALALVGESVEHPERYWATNVGGTRNLLDRMRETQTPRLVFSSTCATYGAPDKVPMDERTPTRPESPYGTSKLAVDLMIGDECRAHGLNAVNLRYGSGFSVRQVIETAREVTGIDIPVDEGPRRPGDPPELVAAGEKIRSELGWEPRKDLEAIVEDAWTWHQAHPSGYSDLESGAGSPS